MAPTSTQSIAVLGAQVLAAGFPAQQTRNTEAAQAAGVQNSQNQARAQGSATQTRNDKTRAIQSEKRTEGIFADQSISDEDDKHGSEQQPKQGKLNKVV